MICSRLILQVKTQWAEVQLYLMRAS